MAIEIAPGIMIILSTIHLGVFMYVLATTRQMDDTYEGCLSMLIEVI